MQRPRPWVIVPGIWNSDPEHWQSRWQAERPDSAVRTAPASWAEPDAHDWDAAISRAVDACGAPPVIVAHSLGVLAAARWLVEHDGAGVAGAFLVAPPDPAAATFPDAARGFTEPSGRSPVPTRLVISDDDPYCSAARALQFARTLGAEPVRVGRRGHVNVASGVGDWADGRALLEGFEATL